MRRILAWAILLSLLLLTSCAATLRLSWTMPVLDNEGTCTSPVLTGSPPNAFVRARFTFSQGATVKTDSVAGRAGQFFSSIPFAVPKAGLWSVAVVTVDSLGNLSVCDTTINAFAKGRPWIVPDLRAQ